MAIKILPPRLANQIAAGEVVERPASVVKELVENSLDAGATRIEVDIEKGGSQLIRIRDNGTGIDKEELSLALSRHATSKIHHLDDLEAIMSLGFRGEALASISSVSRLTLTSKTQSQQEAWSAYAEGRDMAVNITPAAHPTGTTVDVADLFFNTPARRKFLRTEKTEFSHIDELLKRIALSRFDVSIILRHNGKQVRQYRASTTQSQIEKRVASVCGAQFMNQSVAVSLEHDGMTLSGWITTPQGAHKQNDLQYCYVNGRMMRDKLINHAIRQSYESSLPLDHYATYVLFITLDPKQVDVNVHPAKHEVRFHQARLVHDFIYQGVHGALQQVIDIPTPQASQAGWRHTTQDLPAKNHSADSAIHANQVNPDPNANEQQVNDQQVNELDSADYFVSSGSSSAIDSSEAMNSSEGINSNTANTSRSASSKHRADKLDPNYNNLYDALFSTPAQSAVDQPALEQLASVQPTADHSIKNNTNILNEKSLKAILANSQTLALVEKEYALLESHGQFFMVNIESLIRQKIVRQLLPQQGEQLISQPLLIPLAIPMDKNVLAKLNDFQPILIQLGIQTSLKGQQKLAISGVPAVMRQHNLQALLPELLERLAQQAKSALQGKIKLTDIIDWLSHQLLIKQDSYSVSDVNQSLLTWSQLLDEAEVISEIDWIQAVDFSATLLKLKEPL